VSEATNGHHEVNGTKHNGEHHNGNGVGGDSEEDVDEIAKLKEEIKEKMKVEQAQEAQ
jgi:hypothetical protein